VKFGWFIPRSLSSQIALVMVAALLVASVVNFVFILGERSRAGLIEITQPAIFRVVDVAGEVNENPAITTLSGRQGAGPVRVPRGGRYFVSSEDPVGLRALKRDRGLEDRLSKALKDANISHLGVRAALRTFDTRRLPGERPLRGFGGAGNFGPGGFGPGGALGPLGGAPPDGQFGFPAGPGGPPPNPSDTPDTSGSPAAQASPTAPPGDGFRRFQRQRGEFGPQAIVNGPDGPIVPRTLLLSVQLSDKRWVSGEFFAPEPPQGEVLRLAASTFVLFAFVLAATLWVANRLSRPLNDLKQAAAKVGAAPAAPEEVAVRGPSDVRQTLEAFNAMSRRVSQLLGEKDVMLGALGHDLRTPLSSLRIRLETMEPEAERQKAIRTIEETARLLEDILELARQGRSTEPAQTMDVSILVEDMVEDYAETGAAVTIGFHERAPAACRAILFRRLLRNLIDNALKYGGSASVSVRKIDGEIEVRVDDDGPGMSAKALEAATQPFVRGEVSRSRSTGGAGLGLALSDYVARNHGGRLILENRSPKGFSAAVRLPLVQKAPAPAVSGS
jgi:signal transduction histidine kinase